MMEYAEIPPFSGLFSRLVLGTMPLVDESGFDRMDKALELGINVVDTAACYGFGLTEVALGKWLHNRGCRNNILLISKGGHPNRVRKRVTPYDIVSDLHDSLAKLGTEYIDLYILHRDDPDVSVATVMDVLNDLYKAGKILALGASNWTHLRIKEANEYAEKNGLQGFAVSSPQYSLAEQYCEPWAPGCVTISGPDEADAREFYITTQMPVLAYSSLARGFFSDRVTPETANTHPEEIDEYCRKSYCGPTNFERQRRARLLAVERGCSVSQIAMAYVLNSKMKVFPITGAANEDELKDSISALSIKLNSYDIDWLDLTIE